jgi:preprotein translocase subunit SecA
VRERYEAKSQEVGPEVFAHLTQMVMLQIVDNHWKDHLLSMDHLRDGIGLRGYAQKDPLQEYRKEGYETFMDLVHRIKEDTVGTVFHLQVRAHQDSNNWFSATATAATAPSPCSGKKGKWAATIPAPAAAARSSRNAAERNKLRGGLGDQWVPQPPLKLPSHPPLKRPEKRGQGSQLLGPN